MNVDGTLQPTGRKMPSQQAVEIKNRTPNIDRSSYWGGIVAADGTIVRDLEGKSQLAERWGI